jgi:tRNA(Ile)-lysidine synthase
LGKKRVEAIPPFEVEVLCPGRNFIEEIGKEMVIEEATMDKFRDSNRPPHTAFMEYESLQFPLKIRNFRPGDRFRPLGAKGTQKLKEFFIDHKVPRFERPNIPLVVSAEMIAWVVGYRIDERVKVTEKTKRILKATII